jgi:hypothetical protein
MMTRLAMPGDDDFVPPRRVFGDNIIVQDPELGAVPFWKSLIWNTANLRNAMARADSAMERTPLAEENAVGATGIAAARADEPDEKPEREATQEVMLAAIMESLDRLNARMDEMERQQAEAVRVEQQQARAEAALLDAEEKVERIVATREAIDAAASQQWRH